MDSIEDANRLINKYQLRFLTNARNRCRVVVALLDVHKHGSLEVDVRSRLGRAVSSLHHEDSCDRLLLDEFTQDREKLDAKVRGETLSIRTQQSDADAEFRSLTERLKDEQWNCKEAWKQIESQNQIINHLTESVATLETQQCEANAAAEKGKQKDVPPEVLLEASSLKRRIAELERQLNVCAFQISDLSQRNYALQIWLLQSNNSLTTQYDDLIAANQTIHLGNLRYSGIVHELNVVMQRLAEKDAKLKAEQSTVIELRKNLEKAEKVPKKKVRLAPVQIEDSEESSSSLPFVDEQFELITQKVDESVSPPAVG